MIVNNVSLSMAEAFGHVQQTGKDKDERNTELVGFMKKFVTLKPEQATEMRQKIEALENHKIKSEHISQLIDLLPDTKEDITKVFNDVSLDDEEVTKLAEIVKQYK